MSDNSYTTLQIDCEHERFQKRLYRAAFLAMVCVEIVRYAGL